MNTAGDSADQIVKMSPHGNDSKAKPSVKRVLREIRNDCGVPTLRSAIRADIDRAVASSTTEQEFIRTMQEMGYQFRTCREGEKSVRFDLKPPGAKRFYRLQGLEEGYDMKEIIHRVEKNNAGRKLKVKTDEPQR